MHPEKQTKLLHDYYFFKLLNKQNYSLYIKFIGILSCSEFCFRGVLSLFLRLVLSHWWGSGFTHPWAALCVALHLADFLCAGCCHFSVPDPRERWLPSTEQLARGCAFTLSYTLSFFPTCCWWLHWTPALICSLPTLKSQGQEASGSSMLMGSSFSRLSLFPSGTKPWKSHLTNPGSADPHHSSLFAHAMRFLRALPWWTSAACSCLLGNPSGFPPSGCFTI